MSSSMTKGMVRQGKLLVNIAENGHSFEVECDETTTVETVMRHVDSVARINFTDQRVLCQNLKLEPRHLLSDYDLPSSDREVFIFNKARLLKNSQPPPLEHVQVLEVLDPPPPPKCEPHPLDDNLDPALKALPSYERQFRYHCHRGHVIYRRTLVNYEACESLLREQKVQVRALEVAWIHWEQFFVKINYVDFMKRYTQQHRVHSELLANFGRNLEILRSIKLHPTLQTPSCRYLVDFVKEENLRRVVENCSNSHRQFEKKISEFKQIFGEGKKMINDLFTSKVLNSIWNLEQSIKNHQRYINEQKSIMQSLSKDVIMVKKLVDDCLPPQSPPSLRPHDAVSALGPMYDAHDKSHLPKMKACGCAISELLKICINEKNEMIEFVHRTMQKISSLTSVVKDAKFQFPVFIEAMQYQDDIFRDLKMVRGIGPAYRACFAEVVRRKESLKLYMGRAGQLAEIITIEREAEVRRREDFNKAYGSYFPRYMLASMGLNDVPSQCDVTIAPFDTNLLDIDITNLDRYAPEYLSMLLKLDKHASLRGSFSISNDSSCSADVDDIVVDNLEKDDIEELFEGSELVEITGTSKMEVENAKLKADLASAIVVICSLCPEIEYASLDDSKVDNLLKNTVEKTAEALRMKDKYAKHLQSMLKAKQKQCLSYEKRIQELEQRLSDQYMQGQKLSDSKVLSNFRHPSVEANDYKPESCDGGEVHMPCASTSEAMDEVSCISSSMDSNLELFTRQPSKGREGVDDHMMDSSGILNTQLDSSMSEPHREELQVSDKDRKDKMVGQLGMSMTNSSTAESLPEPVNLPSVPVAESKLSGDLMAELQCVLAEKSNQLSDTGNKLRAAVEEVSVLSSELEMSRKLLDESQLNCAHLENCLHEAREEVQTHIRVADRRASEYSSLRASFLKVHGCFERFRSSVLTAGGVDNFADTFCAFAKSLANSISDKDDDATVDLIQILADRVGFLPRHREELLEKCPKLEATNELLLKELEDKKEPVTSLYEKYQLEKQASKEKICFNRLEVHEIAAFVLNSAGHYEAINQSCSNYYLSAESVALFTDHLTSRPTYIIGQIVYIERRISKPSPPPPPPPFPSRTEQLDLLTSDSRTDKLTINLGSSSNPYGLPVGREFFIVTVSMLPDMVIHSPPSS